MALGKGAYPFARKIEQYKGFSEYALAWSLGDATRARDVCGKIDAETFGWYADDVHTILDEIRSRKGMTV